VFTGLHVDVDAVRKDNEAKQGPDVVRKSGLIINSGGAQQLWPPFWREGAALGRQGLTRARSAQA
jgi:hypothetical protein